MSLEREFAVAFVVVVAIVPAKAVALVVHVADLAVVDRVPVVVVAVIILVVLLVVAPVLFHTRSPGPSMAGGYVRAPWCSRPLLMMWVRILAAVLVSFCLHSNISARSSIGSVCSSAHGMPPAHSGSIRWPLHAVSLGLFVRGSASLFDVAVATIPSDSA